MLTTSFSPLFFSVSPPVSSSNYIRQLETKVRILEDDNNKLLSQVRHKQTNMAHIVHINVVVLHNQPLPVLFEPKPSQNTACASFPLTQNM